LRKPIPFLVKEEELSFTGKVSLTKRPVNSNDVRCFMYNSRQVDGLVHQTIKSMLAHLVHLERERQNNFGGPVEIASVFAGIFRHNFLGFSPSVNVSEEPRMKASALFPFVYENILSDVEKVFGAPADEALYRLFRWAFYYYAGLVEKDAFFREYDSLSLREKKLIDTFSSFWDLSEEAFVRVSLQGILNGVAYFVLFLEHLKSGKTPEEASYSMEERFEADSDEYVAELLKYFEQEGPVVDNHLAETMAYFASYSGGEKEAKIAEQQGRVYHFKKAIPFISNYRKLFTKRRKK